MSTIDTVSGLLLLGIAAVTLIKTVRHKDIINTTSTTILLNLTIILTISWVILCFSMGLSFIVPLLGHSINLSFLLFLYFLIILILFFPLYSMVFFYLTHNYWMIKVFKAKPIETRSKYKQFNELVKIISINIGCKNLPRIYYSTENNFYTPIIFGSQKKPILFVPDKIVGIIEKDVIEPRMTIERITQKRMIDVVIAHELSHIRNGDVGIIHLFNIIRSLTPFWLISILSIFIPMIFFNDYSFIPLLHSCIIVASAIIFFIFLTIMTKVTLFHRQHQADARVAIYFSNELVEITINEFKSFMNFLVPSDKKHSINDVFLWLFAYLNKPLDEGNSKTKRVSSLINKNYLFEKSTLISYSFAFLLGVSVGFLCFIEVLTFVFISIFINLFSSYFKIIFFSNLLSFCYELFFSIGLFVLPMFLVSYLFSIPIIKSPIFEITLNQFYRIITRLLIVQFSFTTSIVFLFAPFWIPGIFPIYSIISVIFFSSIVTILLIVLFVVISKYYDFLSSLMNIGDILIAIFNILIPILVSLTFIFYLFYHSGLKFPLILISSLCMCSIVFFYFPINMIINKNELTLRMVFFKRNVLLIESPNINTKKMIKLLFYVQYFLFTMVFITSPLIIIFFIIFSLLWSLSYLNFSIYIFLGIMLVSILLSLIGLNMYTKKVYYVKWLQMLSLLSEILLTVNSKKLEEYKSDILDFLIKMKCNDGGYKQNQNDKIPSLECTWWACSLIHYFNLQSNKDCISYLLRLEHPNGGFINSFESNIPRLSSTFRAFSILNDEKMLHLLKTPIEKHKKWILSKQNRKGGFSEYYSNFTTLRDTYAAVKTLEIIGDVKGIEKKELLRWIKNEWKKVIIKNPFNCKEIYYVVYIVHTMGVKNIKDALPIQNWIQYNSYIAEKRMDRNIIDMYYYVRTLKICYGTIIELPTYNILKYSAEKTLKELINNIRHK